MHHLGTAFLASGGALASDDGKLESLLDAWKEAPPGVRRGLRVSRHFGPWLDRRRRMRSREDERAAFLAEVAAGDAGFDTVKHPLLPYQRTGTLDLAFGERALPADEMGLGKTVQAIAACELLARRRGIARVLVVCPASLKEQIAKFTDRKAQLIFGSRAQRLAAYTKPAFFNIVNYEQMLTDAQNVNAILSPDVVVLDETQRIKNWHTKTARQVKLLRSPYAFVLTGTPLENRIDELYSIIQYLDPELVGPLFCFNREFYDLDQRGRPVDYKNLAELKRRIAIVMLRRRKSDVETELPGRTVKTFFVLLVGEQRMRYHDYRMLAARLIAILKEAPAHPRRVREADAISRLHAHDLRYASDSRPGLPHQPQARRLGTDPLRSACGWRSQGHRVLRVGEDAGAGSGAGRRDGSRDRWHTGSVPQQRRRAEILRLKRDPACRLFLSTDSGSVGLNLRIASAVVNVDLPWNPAKLEQRIARAWRKHQTRSVSVVNLVCEQSIEHGIMFLLAQKQALADGLLDGEEDISKLKMPSAAPR